MIETVWKGAFTVAGLGAVAAFVIWSLYRHWLQLPIFQTLTKKDQFRLFRLFLILTFLFAVAGLVAFVIAANKPGRTEPEVRIEAVDSTTGDRIHQPLTLTFQNGTSTMTKSGVTDLIRGDFNELIVSGMTELKGYLPGAKAEYEDDPTTRIRTYKFQRRAGEYHENSKVSFADAIRPSQDTIDRLTRDMDEEKYHEEMEAHPPSDVKLLCQNNTTTFVDIFWYRYAPPEIGRRAAGFSNGWHGPWICPPTHGEQITLVDPVALSPGGYFYIFGSRHGLRGVYLGEGNLFRDEVAVLVIDNDEEGELKGTLSHRSRTNGS